MDPTSIVAYVVLFAAVGFLFLFAALLAGRLARPKDPTPQKLETYECGEPSIGSSFVQFDLRFYVVALIFLIFDVEVAFFFPWATVYGKTAQLTDIEQRLAVAEASDQPDDVATYSDQKNEIAGQMGMDDPKYDDLRRLGLVLMADIGVFFAVLMVGFAYVWWRGDISWVRAIGPPAAAEIQASSTATVQS
ncbi:MAG: NADH-quinone oxidoreductase subunit A [Planctomycetes bacterium]|nr:NADH-quinone oxidoreductase subunit A [Planctomycetota bacterium]